MSSSVNNNPIINEEEYDKSIQEAEQSISLAQEALLDNKMTQLYIHTHYQSTIPLDLKKNIDDVIGGPSDVMNGLGELVNNSNTFQRISHISDTTAAGLNKAGDIGASIAGGLSLFTVGFKCIKERRSPTGYERAKMLHSAIILTLGCLALTGVGGPVAVSAYMASIVYLTFTKTIAELFRDRYRLKQARIARNKAILESYTLNLEVNQMIQDIHNLIDQFKRTQATEKKQELIQRLREQIEQLKRHTDALKHQDLRIIQNHYKYELLEKRLENQLEKIQKTFTITIGVASIIGASLTLTPLAPVGLVILGISAAASLITLIAFTTARFLKNRQIKKELKKEKIDSQVTETTEINSSDAHIIKELSTHAHASESAQEIQEKPQHCLNKQRFFTATYQKQDSNRITNEQLSEESKQHGPSKSA